MRTTLIAVALTTLSFAATTHAHNHGHGAEHKALEVSYTIPKINESPYHRPYVAIWVEDTDGNQVATLQLHKQLKKGDKWLKDLRQFWRRNNKRASIHVDGVTSATKRPGKYTVSWDGLDQTGKAVALGEYVIRLEASREDGGRNHVKRTITVGQEANITIPASPEIGPVQLTVFNAK